MGGPMSILGNIFGRKEKKLEYKSISTGINPDSFTSYALTGSLSRLTVNQAMEFYRSCSAVATAVDLIADEIEQLEPILMKEDGEVISSHPLLDLLKKPNPAEDYRTFIGLLARHWLLTRNAPLAAIGNVKFSPINLWALKPQYISTIESGVDGYPASFLVTGGPAQNSYLRQDERNNWRYLAGNLAEFYRVAGFSSQSSSSFPDSPLQAAALEIRQHVNGRVHNARMLQNGARLSLIAVMKDGLSADEHAERSLMLNSQLAGPNNAGKVAVISSEDLELKEVGTTNKDMDYAELDKISSLSIFMRYKIPLPLVTTENSTYNNMNQAKFDLYDRAVLPAFNVLAQGLSRFLLLRYGLDPAKFRITYNSEKITAVRGRLLEELKTRRDLNLETINEMRSSLPNREDIDSGGDTIYQPANLIPVGSSADINLDDIADLDESSREQVTDE